jgi:hypothetical protein
VKEAFGVKCDASQPQSAPDVMAWDSAARTNLSRLRDKAVRYEKHGGDFAETGWVFGGYKSAPHARPAKPDA